MDGGSVSDDKRRFRRETRLLQNESSWLQKALFALRKIEDIRDRLAELHDRDAETYTLHVGGDAIALEEIEDALETRAAELQGEVRERRNRRL